jgi:hypothetical protein
MTQPTIFVSYSHKDETEKDKLLVHLGVLQRAGLINLWSDDQIGAGAAWEPEITAAMAQARVAILLITANFLNSDFILRQEVPSFLKRRKDEGLTIFPVIATACAWRMVDWLAAMNVRPKNGRPVWSDGGSHVDEDLAVIAVEVATIIKKVDESAHSPVISTGVSGQTMETAGDEGEGSTIQALDDRDWDSLLYRIKAGKCTPFIGPEVCREIFPPDSEIARTWATKHVYPLDDIENMPRVAQFLAVKRDPAFPADEMVRQLAGIEAQPDFGDPNEPHSFLAGLPLPIYITTNYDNFMMQALKHHSQNATREVCRWNKYVKDVPSVFDVDSKVKVSQTSRVVYHLFGHTELSESMVLTEDDYLDFLVNISRNQSIIPAQIEKSVVQTSLLFIGYRLSDIRFRVLFRGLIASLERSLRRTSVAVQLRPEPPDTADITESQVREYLQEYLSRDDVRVYWGDSFEFIRELKGRWEEFNDRQ